MKRANNNNNKPINTSVNFTSNSMKNESNPTTTTTPSQKSPNNNNELSSQITLSSDTDIHNDSLYCIEMSKRSIARAALHLGIKSITSSTLNVLGQVMLDYMTRIANTISHTVEYSNRSSSHVNVLDVLYAVEKCTCEAARQICWNEENDLEEDNDNEEGEGEEEEEEVEVQGVRVKMKKEKKVHPVKNSSNSYIELGMNTSSNTAGFGWESLATFLFGNNWWKYYDDDEEDDDEEEDDTNQTDVKSMSNDTETNQDKTEKNTPSNNDMVLDSEETNINTKTNTNTQNIEDGDIVMEDTTAPTIPATTTTPSATENDPATTNTTTTTTEDNDDTNNAKVNKPRGKDLIPPAGIIISNTPKGGGKQLTLPSPPPVPVTTAPEPDPQLTTETTSSSIHKTTVVGLKTAPTSVMDGKVAPALGGVGSSKHIKGTTNTKGKGGWNAPHSDVIPSFPIRHKESSSTHHPWRWFHNLVEEEEACRGDDNKSNHYSWMKKQQQQQSSGGEITPFHPSTMQTMSSNTKLSSSNSSDTQLRSKLELKVEHQLNQIPDNEFYKDGITSFWGMTSTNDKSQISLLEFTKNPSRDNEKENEINLNSNANTTSTANAITSTNIDGLKNSEDGTMEPKQKKAKLDIPTNGKASSTGMNSDTANKYDLDATNNNNTDISGKSRKRPAFLPPFFPLPPPEYTYRDDVVTDMMLSSNNVFMNNASLDFRNTSSVIDSLSTFRPSTVSNSQGYPGGTKPTSSNVRNPSDQTIQSVRNSLVTWDRPLSSSYWGATATTTATDEDYSTFPDTNKSEVLSIKVPPSTASDVSESNKQPRDNPGVVALARASSTRISRILEGSLDASS